MRTILIIARYTFVEIYKSRILLNVLFIGMGIMMISYMAFKLTYGEPARISLDFGLGTLAFSTTSIAIFMGVSLVQKELENCIIHMIISRPVGRIQFLVGKILGGWGILLANVSILSLITIGFFKILGGSLTSLLFWTVLFVFLEALIVMLTALLLSLITNNTISVICTIVIFILGHAINDSMNLPFIQENPTLFNTIKFYSYLFPDFSRLNIKSFVLHEQSLSMSFIGGTLFYAIFYSLALTLLLCHIFKRKDLD